MRKFLKLAPALTLVLALALAGCASQGKVAEGYTDPAIDGAPSWVFSPEVPDMLADVGSSPKSPAGYSFQRTEAMSNARDALARQLETRVQNSFKNYTEQTGVEDDITVDKVVKNVSNQLAKQTLNGSTQKDMWIARDGTMYVLIVLDSEKAAEAAKKNALSSLKNEKALWQKFQAKKAQEELSQEIEKEFGI